MSTKTFSSVRRWPLLLLVPAVVAIALLALLSLTHSSAAQGANPPAAPPADISRFAFHDARPTAMPGQLEPPTLPSPVIGQPSRLPPQGRVGVPQPVIAPLPGQPPDAALPYVSRFTLNESRFTLNESRFPFRESRPVPPPSAPPSHVSRFTFSESLSPSISASKAITLDMTYGSVTGYTTANSNVRLRLWHGATSAGEARTRSDAAGYFTVELMHAGRWAQVQPGDTLDVEVGASKQTLVAPSITGSVVPGTNTVSGVITGVTLPATLLLECLGNPQTVTTDGSGNFSASFAGLVDIAWDVGVRVSTRNADGNGLAASLFPLDGVVIQTTDSALYGYTAPGATVAATVTHLGEADTLTVQADRRDGSWYADFKAVGAGDAVLVDVGGAPIAATAAALTLGFDLPADEIVGTAAAGSALSVCSGQSRGFRQWISCRAVTAGAGGDYSADFSAEGLTARTTGYVWRHGGARDDTFIYAYPPMAIASWSWNGAEGYAEPGAAVTATLHAGALLPAFSETVKTSADPETGYFWMTFETAFKSGNRLTVEGGGLDEAIDLVDMTATLDLSTDAFSGQAPANAPLYVVSGPFSWFTAPSFEDYVTSGAGGAFSVSLGDVIDVHNGRYAFVAYPQDKDVDQAGWQDRFDIAPQISVNETHDGLDGYVPAEQAAVTLTLSAGGAEKGVIHTKSDPAGGLGWQQFTDGGGKTIDIAPGDEVLVETTGWSQTVIAPEIGTIVDSLLDRVTGAGPANSFLEVSVRGASPRLTVPTGADGSFMADFDGLVDIGPGTEVEAALFDDNWNRLYVVGQPFFARANIDWNAVDGQFGPGVTVQYTVTDPLSGKTKGGGQGTTRPDGWLDGIGCGDNCDMKPWDLVEVTSDAGFDATLAPIAIEGEIDVAADRLSGTMHDAAFPAKGGIWVWSNARQEGAWLDIDIEANGNYAADFSGQFDIRLGDSAEVWYFDAHDNWVGTMLYTPRVDAELWFNPDGHSNMWGRAQAGAAVTITTAYTHVHLVADENRNWNVPDIGPLQPGDEITVDVAGLPLVSIPVPDPFDAEADSSADEVRGQVGGRANKPIEVHGYWDDGYREVTTDDAGNFTASYDDVPRGAQGHIRWVSDLADYAQAIYHRPFLTQDMILWINTAGDHVMGAYALGHTGHFTITDGTGAIKATATADTQPDIGWGGVPGFSISGESWSPPWPDIKSGDWVTGTMDNEQSASARVGVITGDVDTDTDRVSGRVYAPWLHQTLNIDCHPWGGPPNTPSKQSTAGPNGDPPYLCQWNPATEWDIVPGQEIGVWYDTPDGNWVGFGFHEAAPDLHVETWSDGGGEAQAGGLAAFQIRYFNRGEVAGDAVLTDTLPAGATYVADSSGFVPTILGDKVVWDLGPVQPMTAPVQFQLVLRNSSAVSETLRNSVDIASQYDRDRNDNHAEAEVHVGSGQPDLWVNADARPGDPTPGQLFRYNINFGNDGPVPSGRACLTETLPAGATFVSLEQPENFGLWELESSMGGKLEFCAASVPGYWGAEMFLNLRLDAGVPYDTQLINRVEIGTSGDSNLDNNVHVNDWTYSRPPRHDSGLDKSWGHGSLAIGGVGNYWIDYGNNGNVPSHGLVLTDTLPAGTTFITSVLDYGWGIQVPFPPVHIIGNRLVWDLGDLEVNERGRFMLQLRVNPNTPPGTLLTNCATVTGSHFEDDPYNNTMCVDETARAAGPNLRVNKYAWWEGPNRLRYQVRIGNIGTTIEHDVRVTDTFPASLGLSNWGFDYWEPWSWQLDGDRLTLTLSRINPENTAWLNLWLDVPDAPYGTFYTNNVEITTPPGDVNPADNSDTVAAATGPDLSVEKWQSGGPSRPKPGELVTYTLHLENHAQAWGAGDVWVTDTLPPGLEFVSARDRLCEGYFCPRDPDRVDGRSLAWNYGGMGNNNWRDLEITARVAAAVRPGAALINTATTHSDNPDDVEPSYGDNTAVCKIRAAGETRYLPLIRR